MTSITYPLNKIRLVHTATNMQGIKII